MSNSHITLDWFRTRTTHAQDYDRGHLAELKQAQGAGVSVVLPARNEAATIRGVVAAVGQLAGDLVDEIVVVDGGSTDDTARIAVDAGARVHRADMVLAEFGPSLGKGDSLWRSLTVTGGDIIVFLDSDIRNPEPKFVTGLLGPLLHDDSVQLVKAFYDRPVKLERVQYETGGGRVTELCARPLLNMFWPHLAGLVQPLSGEYAGRRRLLESLPFFTGYGVELGMLIDTVDRHGPGALAQVDLDTRVHRNQGLPALSRMAYGIMQVAVQRLYEEGRADLPPGLSSDVSYVQFERSVHGVDIVENAVTVHERPPVRTLR